MSKIIFVRNKSYITNMVMLVVVIKVYQRSPKVKKRPNLENISLEEYTTPAPYFVKENDLIVDIMRTMGERGIRHLPVLKDDGSAVGIISDRDVAVMRTFAFKSDVTAKDLMTPDPFTLNYKVSLLEAAYTMSRHKIGSIIVNDDDGSVYGIFTSTDALNALVEVLRGDVDGERDYVQDY